MFPIALRGVLAAALGALSLAAPLHAQSLTGRITDAAGLPLAGIPVELDAGAVVAVTDANGVYSLAPVPPGAHVMEVLPAVTTLAPRRLPVTVSGATNLGDLALQPGATISGTVLDPNGLPVVNCNLDAKDATNTNLFLPNDSTDAAGQFLVVVPIGSTVLEVLPPVGSTLVARQRAVEVPGPVDVGVIQLPQGLAVTGSVRNASSLLPISSVTVHTIDNVTGFEIPQLAPQTNAFGIYSVNLPVGVFRIEVEPPPGLVAAVVHGEIIVRPGHQIAPIDLVPGVLVTGTIVGPAGVVPDCDIDAITPAGHKLFTPNDNTNANGVFSLTIPPGTYRFQLDPPAGSGLVGDVVGPFTFAAAGSIGTHALAAGIPLQIDVIGQNGPEFDADLDLTDAFTGEQIVLAGDHADRSGRILTTIPAGIFHVSIDAPRGSASAAFAIGPVPLGAPLSLPLQLPAKRLRLSVTDLGVLTSPPSGPVIFNLGVQNFSPSVQPTALDVFVRLPSGAELTILPPVALDLFGSLSIVLNGVGVPLPVIGAEHFGHELRLYVRARDNNTGALLDEDYTTFVVR